MFYRSLCLLSMALGSLAMCTEAQAVPAGFKITEIANSNPSDPLTYANYSWAAINESGVICYKGADNTRTAIIKSNGINRAVVASSEDASGLFDQFTTGICSINDNGDVAFDACQNCSPILPSPVTSSQAATSSAAAAISYGVYAAFVADQPAIPFRTIASSDANFNLVSLPTINNSGTVSFSAEYTNGAQAVLLKSGGTFSTAVDTSGIFSKLGAAFLNNSGLLTFGAEELGPPIQTGIYDPAGARVIGSFSGYSKVSLPALNNNGTIVTMAISQTTDQAGNSINGVFRNKEAFILNTGDFQRVDISAFQGVSINDLGDVVFPAFHTDGTSVAFIAVAGGMLPLIQEGEFLPGHSSPVSVIGVSREAINNSRQIALSVVLADGTNLVLRLDPQGVVFPGDQCPADNTKFEPGVCGCGVSDADANHDGVLNCQVTSTLHQRLQELLGNVKKVKRLADSASKAKKKAMKQLINTARAQAAAIFTFVQGSDLQIQINSTTKDPAKLAGTIRSQVRTGTTTANSNFAQNKRKAITAINALDKILVL
ncbi:MAG: hypothetical protein K1X83_10030 [Oligoflexia bacterium]|nr:hypothetical protein [Oligoflexia bacterium]